MSETKAMFIRIGIGLLLCFSTFFVFKPLLIETLSSALMKWIVWLR